MLSSILFTTFVALSGVSARMSNHRRSGAPAGYSEGYLEKYDVYHARYMALSCNTKHNTHFFEECCHPLLGSESLSTRPAECNPSATSTSSAPAATPTDDDDEYCEEGDDDCVCEDDGDDESTTMTAHKATSTKPVVKATASHSSSQVQTGGQATYFLQNGNAGACGKYHSDNDKIAAIQSNLYGKSGSTSSHCGQQIEITRTDTGKKVTVTVADECPSCQNTNSIDLSVGAFTQIATKAEGEVPISWIWL